MGLDCDEIIPGRLWVGGYVREEDVLWLRQIGVTTVVSLQTDEDLREYDISPQGLAFAYQDAGIELRRVPTPDYDWKALQRNLPDAAAQVEAVLANPLAKLYLHCTAGINRSATTAAGFLIRSRGLSAHEARSYLISRRDCSPALDILVAYEAMLRSAPC
jgi:hypothetical protein